MELCRDAETEALVVDGPVSPDAADCGLCSGRSQHPDVSALVATDSPRIQTVPQLQ